MISKKHLKLRKTLFSLALLSFFLPVPASADDDTVNHSFATTENGGLYIIEDNSKKNTPSKKIMYDRDIVVMQGLDKVTARVSEFEIDVGDTYKYGSLFITPHLCKISSPLDLPESASLLEIEDKKPNEVPKMVFSGWMMASSPALNSLEHPVYDVWVVECKSREMDSDSDPA